MYNILELTLKINLRNKAKERQFAIVKCTLKVLLLKISTCI